MPPSPLTADSQSLTAGSPLDYSFKNLKTVNDLLYEAPVSGKPRLPPLSREQAAGEYLEALINSGEAWYCGRKVVGSGTGTQRYVHQLFSTGWLRDGQSLR